MAIMLSGFTVEKIFSSGNVTDHLLVYLISDKHCYSLPTSCQNFHSERSTKFYFKAAKWTPSELTLDNVCII